MGGSISSNEADDSSAESTSSSTTTSSTDSENTTISTLSTHSEPDSVKTLSNPEDLDLDLDVHPAPVNIPLSPPVPVLAQVQPPSPALATAGSSESSSSASTISSTSETEEKIVAAITPLPPPLISVMELTDWENGMAIPAGYYHPNPNYIPNLDFIDVLNLSDENNSLDDLLDLPVAGYFGYQLNPESPNHDLEVANSHQLNLYNLPPLDPNQVIIDNGEPLPDGIGLPLLWRNLLFSPENPNIKLPSNSKIMKVVQRHQNPDYETPPRRATLTQTLLSSPNNIPVNPTLSPYLFAGCGNGELPSTGDELNKPSTSGYIPPKRLTSSSSARSSSSLSESSTSAASGQKRKSGGYHYYIDLYHPFAAPVRVFKRQNRVNRDQLPNLRRNQNCQHSQTVREFDTSLTLQQAANSKPRNPYECGLCGLNGHFNCECSPSKNTIGYGNSKDQSTQTPPLEESPEKEEEEERKSAASEDVSSQKKKPKF